MSTQLEDLLALVKDHEPAVKKIVASRKAAKAAHDKREINVVLRAKACAEMMAEAKAISDVLERQGMPFPLRSSLHCMNRSPWTS